MDFKFYTCVKSFLRKAFISIIVWAVTTTHNAAGSHPEGMRMQQNAKSAKATLPQRQIFWFWLPLAASWAFMTLEGPMIQATIARLPDAKTMLAAAGIVISLEVTIESPVIMLLATSTALATSAQAYRVLGRYVLYLNLLMTGVAALIAFADPVFYALIPGLMGIPLHIAEVARPALQIMTLWAAAIG